MMKERHEIKMQHASLVIYGSVAILLFFIAWLFLNKGIITGLGFSLLPFLCYFILQLVQRPVHSFLLLIIADYFIMGITRYVPGLPGGVVIDVLLLFTLFVIFLHTFDPNIQWKKVKNPLTVITFIWLIYCILLAFNPNTDFMDWSSGVRGVAVYLFLFPLLTALLINEYKYLKWVLFIWAILTVLAVIKSLVQKYIGFDAVEKHWLYALGGARTHVIYSGTRYFSFFTDAAAFGCSMGLSMVVFSIRGLYCTKLIERIFYFLVAIAAGYAMMISGTRAAIIIPFAGYAFFVILSKQWKIIIPMILLLLCAFIFLKYTYIGNDNPDIRRMRTAFRGTEDASFNVRIQNQAKMAQFMKYHPFGIGIGKAKDTEEGNYMHGIATDSSLVYIWVETGIVGLILYLFLFFFVLAKGAYDVLFRLRNKELRGLISAILSGLAGMLVSSYGNEVLQQFPNGPIVYICMAFVFLAPQFDKELSDGKAI